MPKFLLAVVVFFVLAYAAAHHPNGANSTSRNGLDCRSDGPSSGAPAPSYALRNAPLTQNDQALELLRANAKPLIEAQLIDKWVPQIGSCEVNGDMSDNDILSSQRTQQSQFHALLFHDRRLHDRHPGLPGERCAGSLRIPLRSAGLVCRPQSRS